jgi:hypothetical protein
VRSHSAKCNWVKVKAARVYFVLIGMSGLLLVSLPIARFWLPTPQDVIDAGVDIMLATFITAQVAVLVGLAEVADRRKEGRRQSRALRQSSKNVRG